MFGFLKEILLAMRANETWYLALHEGMRLSCLLYADTFKCSLTRGSQHGPFLGNSSRRLSNVIVAAERSSMNGPQESKRRTGTRYPSIALLFHGFHAVQEITSLLC